MLPALLTSCVTLCCNDGDLFATGAQMTCVRIIATQQGKNNHDGGNHGPGGGGGDAVTMPKSKATSAAFRDKTEATLMCM